MLPNFKEKLDKTAVFTPKMALDYRIRQNGKPDFPVPKAVVFCVNWNLLDYILNNYEYKEVEGFPARCYLLDDILVVSKYGIGAPTTVSLMEELIAYGVKNFISIGNAGAISEELKIGELVVCEKAIRDEGVSYHYIAESKYALASSELTEMLKKSLEMRNLRYCAGTSWTTDAFYRETIDEVNHYKAEGVLTVEMEASAIFSVAEYRGVKACAIFTISDIVSSGEWKPAWKEAKVSYSDLFDAVMDFLKRFCE
ncbi:MAG: nucleoside phosphorylase [Candidatus Nanoarchaeia archaeon]